MGIPDRYKMLAEAIDNYDAGQTADSEVIIGKNPARRGA